MQSATYVAGLIGGWLCWILVLNNFTTISALQSSTDDLWNLIEAIFKRSVISDVVAAECNANVVKNIVKKVKPSLPVSGTDFWGRILSYRSINTTDGDLNYTWSNLRDYLGFLSGNSPFPIVVVDNQTKLQSTPLSRHSRPLSSNLHHL